MAVANKKILIIEDERPISRALEFKLKHAGFEVKTAFDGEEGVALLQKETYALVLLDLVMPNMDGFKVLEAIKEKKIETSVVVLSNLSQEDDKKRAKEFGVKEFFVKSDTSITTIVERIIRFFK